eukprot:784504-Amorphochlora_amoeboformis.AAC.1
MDIFGTRDGPPALFGVDILAIGLIITPESRADVLNESLLMLLKIEPRPDILEWMEPKVEFLLSVVEDDFFTLAFALERALSTDLVN